MNYKGIAYLRRKLLSKRSRVETRYRYYEMKDFHQPRHLMVPADLQNKFDQALGDNLNTPKLLTQLHIALSEPHANTLDIVKDLEEKVLKI